MLYKILALLLCSGCSFTPLCDCSKGLCDVSDAHIDVDVIAERDGQKLRRFILDALRNLRLAKKGYRLTITLDFSEKPFAHSSDGNAKRLRLSYRADVILKDEKGKEIFSQPISVHTGVNIAGAHREVILALYGRNNNALLRELSSRIVENIRVFLISEN